MSTKVRVIEILKNIGKFSPSENEKEDLFNAGVLDSLTVMELIGELDESFGIELELDDVCKENFDTIEHIVKIVEKYL